jgi:hypothetical protein
MIKRYNFLQFGEQVAGYDLPVLNEREIRAAAGILFLVMFLSLMLILFRQDFLLIKYVIAGFLTDFSVRVLINPRFSPTLIIGRLIVGRQPPEYVGAPQKRFAWSIGLVLSSLMFLLLVVLNSYSIVTGITCLVCLSFLFFETAFGICAGCLLYHLFHKNEARCCAGEQCDPNRKPQHTSWGQLLSLCSFLLLVSLSIFLFNDDFRKPPKKLWEARKSEVKHPG